MSTHTTLAPCSPTDKISSTWRPSHGSTTGFFCRPTVIDDASSLAPTMEVALDRNPKRPRRGLGSYGPHMDRLSYYTPPRPYVRIPITVHRPHTVVRNNCEYVSCEATPYGFTLYPLTLKQRRESVKPYRGDITLSISARRS